MLTTLTLAVTAAFAAQAAASPSDPTPPGDVRGIVFDSTTSRPLPGARVGLLGTLHRTEADGDGRFVLGDVPDGEYTLIFWHPRLQELGVSSPTVPVRVPATAGRSVTAAVPSRATIAAAWCVADGGRGELVVAGQVRDSVTEVPLPRALVTLARPGRADAPGSPGTLETRTDQRGEYRFCDVPRSAGRLALRASFGAESGRARLVPTVPEARTGGVRMEDLLVTIAAAGAIRGRVRAYGSGEPLPSAEVRLVGSDRVAVTDAEGRFTFRELPPGRHVLETRMLGREPRTDSLTIFNREHVSVELEMASEAILLEPLVVTARSMDRFDARGLGTRFDGLTRLQIEELLPRTRDVGDLLQHARIPGLSVRPMTVLSGLAEVPGLCIEHARVRSQNCSNMVEVYVDDVRVVDPSIWLDSLDPEHIEHIQLLSPLEAGAAYGTGAGNGVLVIRTRR